MREAIASRACAFLNDGANVAHEDFPETSLMTRVAVGGFLHETNTFAPTKATYDDFVHGGGWPSMTEGTEILTAMRKINVGLARVIAGVHHDRPEAAAA